MKILQEDPKRILLSNDAFYCLLYDEEPIDTIFIEEAKEVMALFPTGFIIEDDWEFQEEGLIAATFTAKAERPTWPEGYLDIMGGWKLLYKILSTNEAQVQLWHESKKTNPSTTVGIKYVKNRPWVAMNKSEFPLWGRVQKWVP